MYRITFLVGKFFLDFALKHMETILIESLPESLNKQMAELPAAEALAIMVP